MQIYSVVIRLFDEDIVDIRTFVGLGGIWSTRLDALLGIKVNDNPSGFDIGGGPIEIR